MTESSPTPAARRTGRIAIIGTIAAVVLALAATGAFAWQKLSGGGTQPHDVLPASAVAYARVDVDPSAGQKIALLKLIRKFPDAATSIGITSPTQDVRGLLLGDLVAECDLDYDKDVKPWLGSRLGIGLLKDITTPVLAIQVTNQDKARKGIAALSECVGEPEPGIAFLDGYALVAEEQSTADHARKDARAHPLADKPAFVKDIDDLGNQGVASAWIGAKAMESFSAEFINSLPEDLAANASAKEEAGKSVALTLRAKSTSLELVGLMRSDSTSEKLPPAPIASLPDTTVLAYSAAGLGSTAEFDQNFEKGWDAALAGFGAAAPGMPFDLGSLEKKTGLRLPDDFKTLLRGGMTFAVGAKNLDTIVTLADPSDLARLDVGLTLKSDGALDLAKRLAAFAGRGGVRLSVEQTGDGAVIATNPGAATELGENGTLGEKDIFRRAVPHADTASFATFIDMSTLLNSLTKAGPPPDVARQIDQLKAISAIGFSTSRQSDHVSRISARINFQE